MACSGRNLEFGWCAVTLAVESTPASTKNRPCYAVLAYNCHNESCHASRRPPSPLTDSPRLHTASAGAVLSAGRCHNPTARQFITLSHLSQIDDNESNRHGSRCHGRPSRRPPPPSTHPPRFAQHPRVPSRARGQEREGVAEGAPPRRRH